MKGHYYYHTKHILVTASEVLGFDCFSQFHILVNWEAFDQW